MRIRLSVTACALLASMLPVVAHADPAPVPVRAGVGIADATWHVGVGSGQHAAKNPNALNLATGGEIDPSNHSNTQQHSYGVQSRLTYRALVVEGSNGKRVALVKSDSYLAQDLLVRRVGQILEKGTSGITYDQILLHVSHNHSSPYYSSPAWGVWLFQDVFEIRAFEYHARAMASAIEQAVANMKPVRMGATTIRHTIFKGMVAHATTTDDGTPGGYPETRNGTGGHGDFNVTVLRFDDMTDPQNPTPLAVWVNHGEHPESLDGYDLITADYLGPLERFVERATGAPLIFSQGDVGSSEGPTDYETLPDGVRRAWYRQGHAQAERGAKYLADSIVEAWNNIGNGTAKVPFSTNFPVDSLLRWTPGPVSHPYPSVSNCRTETTVEGAPGSPILGLPDCERGPLGPDKNNMTWETLKSTGAPLPDQYDAPAFGAVEENARLKLQVMRIGEVLFASCACESQVDLILNLESRADDITGNIFDGYEWPCTQRTDTTWDCLYRDPPSTATVNVSDARYRRMHAQIHNDAKGWDDPLNAVAANSEPADPAKIWGNFTKEELSPGLGYALPVGVGHAGDYNGYTVSYREYMSRDHYRKALTSYGPHTADYMVTRLVKMAAFLKGGPALAPEALDPLGQADEARQIAESTAIGTASSAAFDAWNAALPSDIGPAGPITEPLGVKRFSAATFTWRGGSNAVDNPRVRVERLVGTDWQPYADQTGEVQTKVQFPLGAQGAADTYAGNQEWKWTANFEAFDAFPRTVLPGGQIPSGDYRFVVDGTIRQAGVNTPYRLDSHTFHVGEWDGVKVQDARVEPNGSASFVVADTYPRTYTSGFRFIKDDGNAALCKTCSFRPWAKTGTIATATVTVTRAGGAVELVPAALSAGRWTAVTNLAPGDHAVVARGGVVDTFGEINGTAVSII